MADERREFARNFEQCFIALPLKTKAGGIRACSVRGLDAGGTLVAYAVTPTYKESRVTYSWDEIKDVYRPIVPYGGYFNVPVNDPEGPWWVAMLVSLHPDRQYRKGLPADQAITSNVLAHSPHFASRWRTIAADALGDSIMNNKVLADHLARGGGRNFVTARRAIEMVESGEHHSVAFSRHFCVHLRRNFAHPVLLLNGQMVGAYADGAFWTLDKYLHFRDFFQKKWGMELVDITKYKKRGVL